MQESAPVDFDRYAEIEQYLISGVWRTNISSFVDIYQSMPGDWRNNMSVSISAVLRREAPSTCKMLGAALNSLEDEESHSSSNSNEVLEKEREEGEKEEEPDSDHCESRYHFYDSIGRKSWGKDIFLAMIDDDTLTLRQKLPLEDLSAECEAVSEAITFSAWLCLKLVLAWRLKGSMVIIVGVDIPEGSRRMLRNLVEGCNGELAVRSRGRGSDLCSMSRWPIFDARSNLRQILEAAVQQRCPVESLWLMEKFLHRPFSESCVSGLYSLLRVSTAQRSAIGVKVLEAVGLEVEGSPLLAGWPVLLTKYTCDPKAVVVFGNHRRSCLHCAAESGFVDLARSLLLAGANPNELDEDRGGPLFWAGKAEMVELLLSSGADPRARDSESETPFLFAAREGRVEVIRALCAAGEDINQRWSRYEATPLHLAVDGGDSRVALALLDLGADVSLADRSGRSPVDLALIRGDEEMVTLLESRGGLRVKETKLADKKKWDGVYTFRCACGCLMGKEHRHCNRDWD